MKLRILTILLFIAITTACKIERYKSTSFKTSYPQERINKAFDKIDQNKLFKAILMAEPSFKRERLQSIQVRIKTVLDSKIVENTTVTINITNIEDDEKDERAINAAKDYYYNALMSYQPNNGN